MSQNVIRLDKERTSVRNMKAYKEDIPKPAKYEVQIKVHGVSLNYRDIAISTSKYPFPVKDNVIPASDAAGIITEVGEGVTGLEVGDHVIATLDPTNLYGPQKNWNNGLGGPVDGVMREYFTTFGASVVKVPKDSPLSFTEWSVVVVTGVTVWNALYGNIPLKPGQTVLFIGMCPGVPQIVLVIFIKSRQVPVAFLSPD